MKKDTVTPYNYNSLHNLHRMLGLDAPLHPLVSLINNNNNLLDISNLAEVRTSVFYKISYKENLTGKIKYGQHYYDFEQGGLHFVSPGQVTAGSDTNEDHSGYTLILHPDFLLSYPLARKITQYGFFSYSANEALHLSAGEKEIIISIFKNIESELLNRIDDFSQDVIITQIESLLTYSSRFYKRQFITRKPVNSRLLHRLENILNDCFSDANLQARGIPTVQYLSGQLQLSPDYLSDMLRSLTSRNAQQHIHDKLITKAKEELAGTTLSISEVAFKLGFEHSQSFSRLFKAKTSLSPVAFRQSLS